MDAMTDAQLNKLLYQAYDLGARAMMLSLNVAPLEKRIRENEECLRLVLRIAAGDETIQKTPAETFIKVTPAFRTDQLKDDLNEWTSKAIHRDRDLAKRIVAGSGLPESDPSP
jgi:hypothetical protein